ncbi:hypothetical protein NY2A_b632R [Paramecium bursaria Chlorella virus NY2A]|uniref:Uncharacterized protein b632R n=1 Tax=Paramecium bursaria Chlorella virus NY2A TaxID=46021 RepID=A7IXF7_PBCVN|nr:hypothetical protein NY2A_b632R [Paramecium bursaria Chlorella virus NY2A]ABT15031.1 hypothetical protein NY2A_b632R [Paramecium bursaria Chlorella virus NY2A]
MFEQAINAIFYLDEDRPISVYCIDFTTDIPWKRTEFVINRTCLHLIERRIFYAIYAESISDVLKHFHLLSITICSICGFS